MTDTTEELNIWSLLAVLVRRRRLVIGLPLIAAVLTLALTWQGTREWVASASFAPQDAQPATGAGGLAATLGLTTGRAMTGSPQFYADLLRSRSVLSRVVTSRHPGAGARGDSADLLAYYRANEESPDRPLADATKKLSDALTTLVDAKTGVVHFEVKAKSPILATDLANHFLAAVDEFNRTRRRVQAESERAFVEERLRVAQDSLSLAEAASSDFQQRNRQWRGSPELSAVAARLDRAINLRQALYVSLAQSAEAARQEELRNTPTIVVLERPEGFAEIRSGGNIPRMIGAIFLGSVLAVGLAFFAEYAKRARDAGSPSFNEIEAVLARFRFRSGRRQRDGAGTRAE